MLKKLTPTISVQHITLLCKYTGISFISGSVNHGFFSGERSLITALLGITLFITGAWLEYYIDNKKDINTHDGLLKTLILGASLSIGLGFFTGGLQHFPDSPNRSAWVIPVGFFISAISLVFNLKLKQAVINNTASTITSKTTTNSYKSYLIYSILTTFLVSAATGSAAYLLNNINHTNDKDIAATSSHTHTHDTQNNLGHQSKHNVDISLTDAALAYQAANHSMHQGMAIAYTSDADADFLAGMIPHHQGAIDMANVVLKYGKDPKIKALAQQIIAAQNHEIADMKQWQLQNNNINNIK